MQLWRSLPASEPSGPLHPFHLLLLLPCRWWSRKTSTPLKASRAALSGFHPLSLSRTDISRGAQGRFLKYKRKGIDLLQNSTMLNQVSRPPPFHNFIRKNRTTEFDNFFPCKFISLENLLSLNASHPFPCKIGRVPNAKRSHFDPICLTRII